MATADKIERLLTLLNVLVDAPRSISAEELRDQVPGYPAEDASFKRAFERDKDDLREMGVPLLVETVPGSDPPRLGYRIRKQEFELRDPGLAQGLEVVLAEQAALLQRLIAEANAVGEQRPFRFVDGNRAELHAASPRDAASRGPRRTAVISAMTEIAISAGLTAPMSRPAGPWIREIAWSEWPSSLRRPMRAAWLRLLPSAAM